MPKTAQIAKNQKDDTSSNTSYATSAVFLLSKYAVLKQKTATLAYCHAKLSQKIVFINPCQGLAEPGSNLLLQSGSNLIWQNQLISRVSRRAPAKHMQTNLRTKNQNFKGKLTCRICGGKYSHLGSHIGLGHGITANEYKAEFGLPISTALISEEIYWKKRNHFDENRDKYLNKFLKVGKKFQFTPGHPGEHRVSDLEKKRIIKRISDVNIRNSKFHPCPVCKIQYLHVESHLYNNHKLLSVKNLK